MSDKIYIGTKQVKNLHLQTASKLEHLLQLAEIEISNYEVLLKNYPEQRLEAFGIPHLNRLRYTREVIQEAIIKKAQGEKCQN